MDHLLFVSCVLLWPANFKTSLLAGRMLVQNLFNSTCPSFKILEKRISHSGKKTRIYLFARSELSLEGTWLGLPVFVQHCTTHLHYIPFV